MLRDSLTGRIARWLAIVPLALMLTLSVSLAAPEQARARAPQTGSDTVALSITNGTTFTYGSSTQPIFTAVVTFGTKPTANYFWHVSVQLETGESFGSTTATTSPDGMTMTFARITSNTPISVGQHTAIASFDNPGTGTTVESNPVPFTIAKASLSFHCGLGIADIHFVGIGQTLHIQMGTYANNQQLPAEWQQGSYTIAFDGPTHLEIPNRASDSNNVVTVAGPTQLGKYSMKCTFNGSPSYAPSSFTSTIPYTFSAMHALGSVQLYTNPTTLVAQHAMDFYVVFKAAPGLPTPTGEFQFYMGNYYTNSIKLSSTGDYLVHLSPVSSLTGISHITVQYWGDIYYNEASVNFPLTNPPIPGGTTPGSTGNGSAGGSPSATTTPQATASASATATEDATATVATTGGVAPSTRPQSGDGNGLLLVIGILVALGLAGAGVVAAGALYFMRRRASMSQAVPDGASHAPSHAPSYAPGQMYYDAQTPSSGRVGDDDTYPYR